jgi:predicted MFS family arabinose efflux permease
MQNRPARAAAPGISRRLVMVMAIACGVAVANLYYAQPLLSSIAAAFGTGAAATGWVVTMSQVGYAAGLLLLVPAGDMLDRRRLVLSVLTLTPVAMAAAGAAPSIWMLYAASLAVGFTSVAVQVLVPFAASLATDEERGRVVGTVISGLLVGILVSRTVSGILADFVTWRGVFYVGAAAMVILALVLRRELPADQPKERMSYPALIRSVGGMLRTDPVIRLRSAFGALGFASFSVFWTTVAFVLARPPYGYSNSVIGLFGLIGAAGAATASLAGRLADKGRARPATGMFAGGLVLSFLVLWLGGTSLAMMVAGVILLDVAVQGLHVLNQSEIYRAAPDARNRANSAYMTAYFVGGSAGSALGAALYATVGWGAVCLLGGALGAAALALWAYSLLREGGRSVSGAPVSGKSQGDVAD